MNPFVLSQAYFKKFGNNLNDARAFLYNNFYEYLIEYLSDDDNNIDEAFKDYVIDNDPFQLMIYNLETNSWRENDDIVRDAWNSAAAKIMLSKNDLHL